ncbi:MAG: GAF domain-containing protein [Chloroflexi bacterium]|nr:GAF domain-containing protein [Chloroflexota bacterium]
MVEQRPISEDQDHDNLPSQRQVFSPETRRRVDQLAAVTAVAAAASRASNPETTLEAAMDVVLDLVPVDAAGISLVDEQAGALVLQAWRGWPHGAMMGPLRVPSDEGMAGLAISRDMVFVTGDLTGDPRLVVPAFFPESVLAIALLPMHARGRVMGLLTLMHFSPYDFLEDDISVLRVIADQVGLSLDGARSFERAHDQSNRLDAILRASADAIIVTDRDGTICQINAAAEALFDLEPDAIIGMSLAEAPLHPRLQAGLSQALNDTAGHTTAVFEAALEDGRFLAAIVSPADTWRGDPERGAPYSAGWVLVVRDVSHLREAEQARVDFAHAAAHDLRNPLGATLGALAMLQNDLGGISELHAEVISIGIQSLERMQTLINNLLHLEHIDTGVGLNARPVDVRELVERGMVDIQSSIWQRQQQFVLDVPDTLPPIIGDIQWLYHALFNLLINANKFTPDGGAITLHAYEQAGEVFVEVSDTGPGIPLELQSRVFERFYRGASDEGNIGFGLGLAIVKSVTEFYGGRVYLQSEVGQGSTFAIIFPVADA